MGRTMVLPVLGKSGTMSWIKKAQGYIIIPRDLEGVREETMVSVINLN